jgi:imidazole glycerol-phosphate synthase subunit HisH
MKSSPHVFVVHTGIANTASILAGLRRAGAEAELTEDKSKVAAAQMLVLPGVGAFGAGMKQLHNCGLVGILRKRLTELRPTLCVCLGLQLLFTTSEEDPGVAGLGVFEAQVQRFPGTVRVPQLGWNKVAPETGAQLVEPGYAYFANSYRVQQAPLGWIAAYADHGGPFVAALEKESVLCCQFHPELSGRWGSSLLHRWLDSGA